MRVQNDDIKEIKEEAKKTVVKSSKSSFKPTFEIEMQDRLDFIITKKMKASSKTLVFLFTRRLFYFYSLPSKKMETVDENSLYHFFSGFSGEVLRLDAPDTCFFDKSIKESTEVLWNMVQIASKTPENKPKISCNHKDEEIDEIDYQLISSEIISIHRYLRLCEWNGLNGKWNSLNGLRELFKKSKKAVLNIKKEDVNWSSANAMYDCFGYNIMFKLLENPCFAVLIKGAYNNEFRNLSKLLKTENFDRAKLSEYLEKDLLSAQLSNITTYIDTLNLQKSLYGEIKFKYPKNIGIIHQVLVREFREKNQTEEYEERFKARMDDLPVNYAYQREKYQIVVPQSGNELVQEGTALCHCVAEYVSKVANGDCVVLFLRERKNLKKPFLTIEVQNGAITQVEGYQRSINVSSEVYKFLEDFAKKKDLKIATFLNVVDE